MKFVKNNHIKYLVIIILLGGNSCNDFLAEDPPDLTTQAKLSSDAAVRAVVNSVYTNLDFIRRGSGLSGGNTLGMLAYTTGKVDGTALSRAPKFHNLTYGSETVYMDTWWEDLYSGVKNANLAIEKLENEFLSLSDGQRINFLAEAKTMRAFYYFYLVRIFGDVPKVANVIQNINQLDTPRAPAKEIYDEIIIPDLLAAESSSLPMKDTSGRVSMGLIKTLLADVYLTYAGYPIEGGDQYYAKSATRSLEVIESGEFPLFDEYTDMIDPANGNSGGFIFQIQFDKINRNNPLTRLMLPESGIPGSAYNIQLGSFSPTEEYIQSYPEGDKRVQEKQYFYSEYDGKYFDKFYPYKYFDKQAVETDARSELNFTIYRIADVMLMYAEASNRAEDGPNTKALQYVNDIRERATLAPIGVMSMEEFEKEVWAQRYFELNFEGKIWFDMVRTRKVYNDITGGWDNFVGHTNVFGATFAKKNLLFPIPQHELDNNSNLTQNPGY